MTVSADALDDRFSGWATGGTLIAIEEVRWAGGEGSLKNKLHLLNKMKPYLSNDVIPVHRKNQEMTTELNTANYFLMSNYADAIPIDDGDRRHLVLQTALGVQGLKEWRAREPEHHRRLQEQIRAHAGALRRWLTELPLHPEFDPDGHAPATAAREVMIEEARSEVDQAVHDLVSGLDPDLQVVGVTPDWVSLHHLAEWVRAQHLEVTERRLGRVLTRLDYCRVPWSNIGRTGMVRWDDRRQGTVYGRRSVIQDFSVHGGTEAIRQVVKALQATRPRAPWDEEGPEK
jgi:hypothetical protein